MKKYLKVKPNAARTTDLRIDLSYSLGGYNVWTYKREPRGYYMTVTPVERAGIMESFVAFTGRRFLLKEVTRRSDKAEREAQAIMDANLSTYIMPVLNANGLELEAESE